MFFSVNPEDGGGRQIGEEQYKSMALKKPAGFLQDALPFEAPFTLNLFYGIIVRILCFDWGCFVEVISQTTPFISPSQIRLQTPLHVNISMFFFFPKVFFERGLTF